MIQIDQESMEDGKYRLLYQMEIKKEEILSILPEESLKDHFDFMKLNIKGRKFPFSLFTCCLSNKYHRLSSEFTQSFSSLETTDKLNYYRKYLDTVFFIAKRTVRIPTTSKLLDENPSGRESSSVMYRMSRFDHWRTTVATLDHTNKILETVTMTIDLHRTFVTRTKETGKEQQIILITPWKDYQNNLEFMKNQLTSSNFFQRIQYLADLALEDNIIRTIEGQVSPPSSEGAVDSPNSDRSLKDRMITETHLLARETLRQVDLMDYLKYMHPTQPLQTKTECKRLVPSKNIHYFFQGEWQINSDGELVAINAKKLQAQGSVIKYVIKRIFTGDKIFSISLPVSVFSDESNLSQLINSYRSAPLELQKASQEESPLNRFLKVIRFAFTCPLCYIRVEKPFNPILGQTYQAFVHGTPIYGEQISHHPPISSVFIKGKGYTAYGSFQAEVKFSLNSASGNNRGWFNISFDPGNISKKIVRFNNAPGEMSGLLFGARKLNLKDRIHFIDEQNRLYCEIAFGSIKYQKVKEYRDSVEGKIVKLKVGVPLNETYEVIQKDIEQDYGLISGRWLSEIYFNRELLINTLKQYPPEVQRYVAMLPSDYSLREDVILKRKGDEEHCQTAKENLEEIQRGDRRLREKYTN